MLLAGFIHDGYHLLIHFAGFYLGQWASFFKNFDRVLLVLSNDKKCFAEIYSTREFYGAKIAVADPYLIRFFVVNRTLFNKERS